MLAPTLLAHGTAEQKARILPAMARADDVWAQAWSEPGAGQRPRGYPRSRAVRADGGWLLSGQKTWSSRAVFADRAFGLFRSDPEAQRHRGLTYLMFDLRAPGVTVRPIPQLDGEAGFAEIFLDEVFVPDADVIGERGDGWRIAMSSAGHERGLSLRSPGRFTAAACAAGRAVPALGEPADSALAERVADAWIGARAYQLYGYGIASQAEDSGAGAGPQASLGKVFWSELDLALQETALDLLGPRAELRDGRGRALAGRVPVRAGRPDLRRHERDPALGVAERVGCGDAAMNFALSAEQQQFAASLHDMLTAADYPAAVRSWAAGDRKPGLEIWRSLADAGVTGLMVAAEPRRPRRRSGRPRHRLRGARSPRGARPGGRVASPRCRAAAGRHARVRRARTWLAGARER